MALESRAGVTHSTPTLPQGNPSWQLTCPGTGQRGKGPSRGHPRSSHCSQVGILCWSPMGQPALGILCSRDQHPWMLPWFGFACLSTL